MQFQELVKETLKKFDENMVASRKVGENQATVVFVDEDIMCGTDSKITLKLVKVSDQESAETKNRQGIHVRDSDPNHLADQIDVALKDGFSTIFVHY